MADLPARFGYLYDFGDGWTHDIEVLGRGEAQPGCGYGEGRCPPEDCGGPIGYAELVEVLADPTRDVHEPMRSWVGEWPEFDQAATDRVVRDMVGQVPPSVALLVGLVGDGVKLTPGGRLPRVLVRQVQQQRPGWYPLDRPAQVEDDLPPLAALHELLRHVGLLRPAHPAWPHWAACSTAVVRRHNEVSRPVPHDQQHFTSTQSNIGSNIGTEPRGEAPLSARTLRA